jgi:putative transposase
MLVEPCEGELHARFFGGWEETRHQSAMPRGAGRLPPTRQERNVLDHLPERDRDSVKRRLRQAWQETDHDIALEQLTALALELDRPHPGAAASPREGMEETLTVIRLGITGKLQRTLQSTNPCESMISTVRAINRNVKNWSSGEMAMRWTAAGMLEAETRFRKLEGYRGLANLAVAIERDLTHRRNKELATSLSV